MAIGNLFLCFIELNDGIDLPHPQPRSSHQGLARSLREGKVQVVVEDTGFLQQKGSGQPVGNSPLSVGVTPEAGEPFGYNPRHTQSRHYSLI